MYCVLMRSTYRKEDLFGAEYCFGPAFRNFYGVFYDVHILLGVADED